MYDEEVEDILLSIIKEFVKTENKKFLDEQKLASSVFYSFAVGVLGNNELDEDKISSLLMAKRWLQEKEDILKGYDM